MKIYLASNNAGKLRELNAIFEAQAPEGVSLLSAKEIGGMPEVEETETSYEGNAKLKAAALLEKAPEDAWVLSDDSGLEVDALDGRPGVYTARFAGVGASSEENRALLLKELKGIAAERRSARFHICLVLMSQKNTHVFEGVFEGQIADSESGQDGFGYDPLFIPAGYEKTNAELGSQLKNQISHRAQALAALTGFIKDKKISLDH